MVYTICLLVTIFLLGLIALFFFNQTSNINNYNIKIQEAIKNIDINQEKQITLLTKLSKKINTRLDKKILTNLPKIKNKNLDMFETEKELYKLNKELNEFIEENTDNLNEEEKSLLNLLKVNSIELKSVEDYYNNQVNNYNIMIKKIPYLLIKIVKHLKKLDVFTFVKEVEFEILKKH